MSLELNIAVDEAFEVDAKDLKAGADARALPFVFPTDFSLTADDGFQPAKVAGKDTGIEVWSDDADEIFETSPDFEEAAGPRRRIISFRWGGSFLEGAFAYGLAAIVVGDHDAVAYDGEEGAAKSEPELLDTFAEMLELAESEQ